MPKSYVESMLGETEKIILVVRQHSFTLISAILFESAMILIIFAASVVAAVNFIPFAPLIAVVGFILVVIPIITMTADILNWSNRQYIITNRRVVQISGVFNKNVTDSSLEKVNDVKMEQSALGRVFGYGDVEILTASELGVNKFKRINDPVRFKTAMLNAKERVEHEPAPSRANGDVPSLITRLDDLRKQGILSDAEFQQKKAELLNRLK
ncbi:MAG: PH domain-containing protein [Chloroflexi bacterium]|nr:PH domain-containing protein [Chloroflexota bacterium]